MDQPLGVRFFQVDPDKGFFLNGNPIHCMASIGIRIGIDMGWAISRRSIRRISISSWRWDAPGSGSAHYQHAQEFYDLCDRGGLVVWAEACLVNHVTDSEAFDATAEQQLRELIKQNYNHPSICFWSLFNELRSSRAAADRKQSPRSDAPDRAGDEAKSLAHELDPTRLTTAASNLLAPNYPRNQITDVMGYNGYDGWYNGARDFWPTMLDDLHAGPADSVVGISEYGAGASTFQHEADRDAAKANRQPMASRRMASARA